MLKPLTVLTCLCLAMAISFIACASDEPMISPDELAKIEENLGYAIAPSWMPEGFEHISGIENPIADQDLSGGQVYLSYCKIVSLEETAGLIMIYPVDFDGSKSFEERIGLEVPEDAVSEIDVNGVAAYLYRGGWSEDTLRRIVRLEMPVNPEWDYDRGISIRFSVNVPDNGEVWVLLMTEFPTSEVTGEDLVRVAKSAVVIE